MGDYCAAVLRVALIRGSGVSLESYRATVQPDGVDALVILPARLIWEKGVGEFVSAARALKERGVAARSALVGDTRASNPRAVPEAQLREWAAEGVVEWWGRREDMAAVFARSHIVCLPSTYGEGVPKVLLEAAASARPIVASDIPGCREVVRTGENGLLVRPGDAVHLEQALETLIADPAMRGRMGRRSREIAEDHFSIDDIAAQTLEVYTDLIAYSRVEANASPTPAPR